MDPLRFGIAACPLAAYLITLGLVGLLRRPVVTTGGRDTAALALGSVGLVMVGPMELFMPGPAGALFHGAVWLILLALYALGVLLITLYSRPRLVIYNITVEELRPILAAHVVRLDSQARWAGDNLVLPGLGIQMHLDAFPAMRTVSLLSTGEQQNIVGWRRLEHELASASRSIHVGSNRRGALLALAGGVLFASALWELGSQPTEVSELVPQFLRW